MNTKVMNRQRKDEIVRKLIIRKINKTVKLSLFKGVYWIMRHK